MTKMAKLAKSVLAPDPKNARIEVYPNSDGCHTGARRSLANTHRIWASIQMRLRTLQHVFVFHSD